MTRHGSHTESRMRENCTYGSMRGILRAEGESRSDALAEVRALPTGRPALLYTLAPPSTLALAALAARWRADGHAAGNDV